MKEYFSCFIGVPLDSEFRHNFEQTQKKLRQYIPKADFTEPRTAHLTLYYLGRQSTKSIEDISNIIYEDVDIIKGEKLKVGKEGLFYSRQESKQVPYVIYLEVEHTDKLLDLKEHLSSHLETYNKEDDRVYIPHITLARLKSEESVEQYESNSEEIKSLLAEITWGFKLREIFIYGKSNLNSSNAPEILYQIPLV